jgi:hypothetical protein
MLGSEYNWLISLARQANGVPKVRIASGGMLTLAVAVFCFLCVALNAATAT